MMQFYELAVTTYLQEEIPFDGVNEVLAKNINRAMFLDEELAELHPQNRFKHYVFSGFSPIERDKVYRAGRVYVFRIRSFDEQFITKIKNCLRRVNRELKVVASEVVVQKYRFIQELTTLTPALATVDRRHWMKGDSVALLLERIHNNLLKKYEAFYGEKLEVTENLIQGVEMINHKAIALRYKGIKMIGNKFRLAVKEDQNSQKLAFVALASGLLEKNATLGLGYCVAK